MVEKTDFDNGKPDLGICLPDYLYLAFRYLTGAGQDISEPQKKVIWEILGLVLFLIWIFLLAAYTWLIRRLSVKVDIVELDGDSGRERIRRKWFDVILQYAFIITGICIRWAYLCLVYFPGA